MAIHQMLVSAWVAHSGRRLAQRAQTADRAPEQKDGGKDQCERDQPKNQAVPYISLPGVRSVDGQGETKNGNTGATQQQENRRNNPEHRPRYSSGASHLALLADSRLPSRSHHMRYTSAARHPNESNSQRFNTLHPHSNDAKKVTDTRYTSMLFSHVYPVSDPRLQTLHRFNECRSTPSPVFSYSYKLPPSSAHRTSSS